MKRILITCICIFSIAYAKADSPLTSTFFAMAYNDVPTIGSIMQRRMSEGIYNIALTNEYLSFLDNASHPLDQKIALINGLGWGETGNTEVFIQHLMKKYSLSKDTFDSLLVYRDYEGQLDIWPAGKVINNHDLLSLAYMHAMGDYFNVMPQANIADYAYNNMLDSQAAACVIGLLISQMMLDINWCGVYHGMDVERFGSFTKDLMRPAATNAIYEYIDLYAESCLEEEMDVVEGDNMNGDLGRMVSSLDYYLNHPCYTKSAVKQISDKTHTVDLQLINEKKDDDIIYNNWVVYNDASHGTDLIITIKNKGNTASIATNLLVHVFSDDYTGNMYLQTEIPSIDSGNSIDLTLTLREYWIYDPDAHFEIILDYDNNIEESDEDNNTRQFFEQG